MFLPASGTLANPNVALALIIHLQDPAVIGIALTLVLVIIFSDT